TIYLSKPGTSLSVFVLIYLSSKENLYMGMRFEKLDKHEALRLVAPVIDGEVCRQTRILFFEHVKKYPEVHFTYKSSHGVKKLLKNRCPKATASADFHQHIRSVIAFHKENKPFN